MKAITLDVRKKLCTLADSTRIKTKRCSPKKCYNCQNVWQNFFLADGTRIKTKGCS